MINQTENPLAFLDRRRSTPVMALSAPAPDQMALRQILGSAIRVPDHGRLAPWRVIEVPDSARGAFAEALVIRHRLVEPEIGEAALEKDRQRFGESPMLLVVVARITIGHKVPEQEQILSGGCVCLNILLAAQALGYSGQWLTGWAAYDDGVASLLGLAENERVLGFLHLGSAAQETPERIRPQLDDVFSQWQA
ncbi:MAG: nitroreductase [Lysobacteraceae bacterium]